MADHYHVALVIHGFEPDPPSVVTRLMGVEPTRAWATGDRDSTHPAARRTYGNWELASPLERTAPLEDHLDALLPALESIADRIREARERFRVGVACAAYFYTVNPGFALSASHIRRLAALGLEVDFDLYCLPPQGDDREPGTASPA